MVGNVAPTIAIHQELWIFRHCGICGLQEKGAVEEVVVDVGEWLVVRIGQID
jgi:hypothetical protein